MRFCSIAAAAAALAFAGQVQAAELLATASDPQGMVTMLEMAGYEPTLDKDQYEDPIIHVDLGGWGADIVFYGCDETSHDGCTELQVIGGFDTNFSVTPEAALDIARRSRFAQTYIDDEGDVWVQWDIVTGKGIPQSVFLKGLRNFTDALQYAGGVVFPEDETAEEAMAATDGDAAADAAADAADAAAAAAGASKDD